MKKGIVIFIYVILVLALVACDKNAPLISGELKKWHPISITFHGPKSGEKADPNPFLDYRLDVTFRHGEQSFVVPGYFAADGAAAETSAGRGNAWCVHFRPNETGTWHYTASFRKGPNVAVQDDPLSGESAGFFDGQMGSFVVKPSDKTGRDFRAKGALQYVGEHYLQFAETGEFYLKGGADSPENFLAYYEFDGAERLAQVVTANAREGEAQKILKGGTHMYRPHARDWKHGDPTWQEGKGRNIIGALNYLAGKGMNSVYFLTMNVAGDGKDVWPWIAYDERYRFDCSKLDQWEIVFSHMDKLGLLQHVIFTETENESLFEVDEGVTTLDGFANSRKLYYREIVARFGHHPALVFNLGEENGGGNNGVLGAPNTDAQRKAFAQYIRAIDPYDHPIVVHTHPGQYDKIYTPLLAFPAFEGPSLQMGDQKLTHSETIKWIRHSKDAGRKWVVCLDEIGPANTGVKPDSLDYWHDDVRRYSLWGNLMAGGSGCEWYFGYNFANNDLNCEDWRSRDHLWDLTRYALEFFTQNDIPFQSMVNGNDLLSAANDYCFYLSGQVYVVYLAEGGSTELDLRTAQGEYTVRWFNPRNGTFLTAQQSLLGAQKVKLGPPPEESNKDWIALIRLTK